MRKSIIVLFAILTATSAFARGGHHSGGYHGGGHMTGTGSNSHSHHVNGYSRRDGTYVAPHYNTNPNHTQRDNYGTINNYNPHNGQYGNRYANY